MAGTKQSHNFSSSEDWPSLPWEAWQETCATLHMWSQVVGKIRLRLAPMANHWWQVPLYVTPRGLTTSPMPFDSRIFQIDFNFLVHRLEIITDRGEAGFIEVKGLSVADFYNMVMEALRSLGLEVRIWTTPVEVADRTPFEQDSQHAAYDPEFAEQFWRALLQVDRVFKKFRSRFIGKVSPVHFFWGAFDHAVTRFSGRRAPEHPGVPSVGRSVMVEAYSHEVSSCGFWPGAGLGEPAFYAYAYPEPEGFKEYPVQPRGAYYYKELGEFILPSDVVRTSPTPDETLLAFLQTTYEAAANLGKWDRASLERAFAS
ncbi:MAG: DUF5996 family protein [Syntrophobacterales bacterium]